MQALKYFHFFEPRQLYSQAQEEDDPIT